MTESARPSDLSDLLPGWIHRITRLHDDVDIFNLDRRGIANNLADLVHEMQEARKRDTP